MPRQVPIGERQRFALQRPCAVEVEGRQIAVFFREGQFFALDDLCPHKDAPLSEGGFTSEAGRLWVWCPWHRFLFDLETGQCDRSGFDTRAYTIEERQDILYIELPD